MSEVGSAQEPGVTDFAFVFGPPYPVPRAVPRFGRGAYSCRNADVCVNPVEQGSWT